jgi:hypothetical protein
MKAWYMNIRYFKSIQLCGDHAVVQLVEALRYKPDGRGFKSRWGYLDFSLT